MRLRSAHFRIEPRDESDRETLGADAETVRQIDRTIFGVEHGIKSGWWWKKVSNQFVRRLNGYGSTARTSRICDNSHV